MSIELESSKLFANFFEEDARVEALGKNNVLQAMAETDPTFAATNWPGSMTFVTGFLYLLGVSGLIGGLFAVRSLANMEAAEILVNRIANYSPEAKFAAAALTAQVKYSAYMYMMLGCRIVLGACFLGVAGLMTKRFDNAHNLTLLVLILTIGYNVGQFVMTYVTTSSITTLPGIDQQVAQAAVTFAVLSAGTALMIKIGIYCGLCYYLTRPHIQALFAPAPTR